MASQGQKIQRSSIIWALLALTIGMTLWTAMQDEPQTEEEMLYVTKLNSPTMPKTNTSLPIAITKDLPKDTKHSAKAFETQPQPAFWKLKPRTQLSKPSHNLFVVHSWAPPPPKLIIKAEVAPPPVAPEAPFFYMGKLEESEDKLFFLVTQQKLFHVRLGEQINAEWRLDSEDNQFLQLTYLPLGLPQRLSKLKKQVNPAFGLDAVSVANH